MPRRSFDDLAISNACVRLATASPMSSSETATPARQFRARRSNLWSFSNCDHRIAFLLNALELLSRPWKCQSMITSCIDCTSSALAKSSGSSRKSRSISRRLSKSNSPETWRSRSAMDPLEVVISRGAVGPMFTCSVSSFQVGIWLVLKGCRSSATPSPQRVLAGSSQISDRTTGFVSTGTICSSTNGLAVPASSPNKGERHKAGQ